MILERTLFVARDGTILEEPADGRIDDWSKVRFVPGVLPALQRLREAGWRLVMVSNQEGLGTERLPTERFTGPHELMMQILESQGCAFSEVLICPHLPGDACACRKPKTGLVEKFMVPGAVDRAHSYVIGSREADLELARNMGLQGLRVGPEGKSWDEIRARILAAAAPCRTARVDRVTRYSKVSVEVWLDRPGESRIATGVGFFDHMLEQLALHGNFSMNVSCEADLRLDDHHTVEGVALALGKALRTALGERRGIRRYGFTLPMDEALARCALDLAGRPCLTYQAKFRHRKVGDLSTEMVGHFFRSLCETMGATLYVKAKGGNDHHIAESLFKAFGRTLRDAARIEAAEPPPVVRAP